MDIGVQRLALCSLTLPLAQGEYPEGGEGVETRRGFRPRFLCPCPGRARAGDALVFRRMTHVPFTYHGCSRMCVMRASNVRRSCPRGRRRDATMEWPRGKGGAGSLPFLPVCLEK